MSWRRVFNIFHFMPFYVTTASPKTRKSSGLLFKSAILWLDACKPERVKSC